MTCMCMKKFMRRLSYSSTLDSYPFTELPTISLSQKPGSMLPDPLRLLPKIARAMRRPAHL